MNRIAFAVSIGALGPPFVVAHAIQGSEGISRLYRFDVEVATRLAGPLFEPYVLGQSAVLAIRVSQHTRLVHGIVTGVRVLEEVDKALGLYRYSLRIAPAAWLMKKRRGSRIFQDQSIPSILRAVAEPLGLRLRFELERERPTRPYTTQFEETDYELFRRLCAENALLFYFEQPSEPLDAALEVGIAGVEAAVVDAGLLDRLRDHARSGGVRETLVVTDRAGYPLIAGTPGLRYRSAGALVAEDSVTKFTVRQRVASSRAVYREYDPERPLAPLEAEHSVVSREPASPGQGEPAPPIHQLQEDQRLELYHHEGRDLHPNWEYGQLEPARALAQSRRKRRLATGTSNVARLQAGHAFVLEEHPRELLDRVWAVTSVHHVGSSAFGDQGPTAYENHFECVPGDVPFVPARRRRTVLQSTMTALVVGPDGEEIHVDEHGRIKVKFHWDRGDDLHEPTCWIRVLHAWSGTVWGTQFLPRVGMEAVVTFENGDPDKPLIIGCVYNRVQPLPFKLPDDKTRSGFRTQSSPRSGGFNELSFQDRANEEQVYLKAQRDFDAQVGHNRTARVSADDSTSIGNDQSLSVGGDQSTTIQGGRTAQIHEDDHLRVHGARDVHVSRGLHIHAASYRNDVTGLSEHQAGTAFRVNAPLTQLYGAEYSEVFGERFLLLSSLGQSQLNAPSVRIAASDDITLSTTLGGAFLRISEDTIQLYAKKIQLNGEDAQLVMADGKSRFKTKDTFQVVSDNTIALKSATASIGLQKEARIDGTRVLLNSPTQALDNVSVEQPPTARIVVTDQDGEPTPGMRVLITHPDGTSTMGWTGPDGVLEAEVEGSATVTFPEAADVEARDGA